MDTKETYQAIFESAPDAVIVSDQSGRIVLVNKQAKKLFGYESPELIGQEVEILIPERLMDRHHQHKEEYAKDPKPREMGPDRELTARRKDGTEFFVEISLSPITFKDKPFVSAAIRDVTDKKAMTRQLQQTLDVLKNKNQELEQFAYVASHDLQEPLRSMINVMDLFTEQYGTHLGADANMYIDFMRDSTIRMTSLIKGLLDYSRIGHNTERQRVNLNKTLEYVVADLSSSIRECNARIEVPLLPTLDLHQVEIRLLFQNLLANAIKFRKKDTRPIVQIGVEKENRGSWHFWVKDNGIGIQQEYLDRIFIIFQRLHTRDEYEGTGIGLSYCRKIAELHGGKIWVESEPGLSSTFHFSILN